MPAAHAPQRGRLEAEPAQRRVQHQVVERDQQHHQQRVQRLHLRRLLDSQLGHHQLSCGITIALPCSTQVDAFWSNSDQNGVTSANTIRMRSTARTPSTASSGCVPRARSSCSEVPMPPKRDQRRPAPGRAAITKPKLPDQQASDADAPSSARRRTGRPRRPGRPCPAACAVSAVRATCRNECGFGGAGGTCTYLLAAQPEDRPWR